MPWQRWLGCSELSNPSTHIFGIFNIVGLSPESLGKSARSPFWQHRIGRGDICRIPSLSSQSAESFEKRRPLPAPSLLFVQSARVSRSKWETDSSVAGSRLCDERMLFLISGSVSKKQNPQRKESS